jgi:hypothetical protein
MVMPSDRHMEAASSRLKTIGSSPSVFIKRVISSGLNLSQQDSNIARSRLLRPRLLLLIFSTSIIEL